MAIFISSHLTAEQHLVLDHSHEKRARPPTSQYNPECTRLSLVRLSLMKLLDTPERYHRQDDALPCCPILRVHHLTRLVVGSCRRRKPPRCVQPGPRSHLPERCISQPRVLRVRSGKRSCSLHRVGTNYNASSAPTNHFLLTRMFARWAITGP